MEGELRDTQRNTQNAALNIDLFWNVFSQNIVLWLSITKEGYNSIGKCCLVPETELNFFPGTIIVDEKSQSVMQDKLIVSPVSLSYWLSIIYISFSIYRFLSLKFIKIFCYKTGLEFRRKKQNEKWDKSIVSNFE